MKNKIFYILFLIFYASCQTYDCDSYKEEFKSKSDAIETIRKIKFRINERIIVNNNEVKYAEYYSCDNHAGYLICKNYNYEVAYSKVPKQIWEEFKKSGNKDLYYEENIVRKFPITVHATIFLKKDSVSN